MQEWPLSSTKIILTVLERRASLRFSISSTTHAKPWSKRCDFIIFYVNGRAFHADCIEFKSKSLNAEKIVPQLKAGACWVHTLKRTIEHYTGDKRKIRLRKFVFAENEDPDRYIDENRQLNADPSIRYYHFDEVHGQSLVNLQNTSVQEI